MYKRQEVEYFRQRLLEAEAAQNLQRDRRSSPRVAARIARSTKKEAGKVDAGRPRAEPQQQQRQQPQPQPEPKL